MKKLHTLALYSLVAPLVTFSAGSVLAQQDTRPQTSTQAEQQVQQDRQQGQSAQQDRQQAREVQSGAASSTTSQSQSQSQPQRSSAQDADQDRDVDVDVERETTGAAASQQRSTRDTTAAGSGTYLSTAPANGMRAGDLIGSDVKSMGNESVGTINDLIIDENGELRAVVVGVGGFLGVGEKDVAIEWDSITPSQNPGEEGIMVDVSRESLNSAPAFRKEN